MTQYLPRGPRGPLMRSSTEGNRDIQLAVEPGLFTSQNTVTILKQNGIRYFAQRLCEIKTNMFALFRDLLRPLDHI